MLVYSQSQKMELKLGAGTQPRTSTVTVGIQLLKDQYKLASGVTAGLMLRVGGLGWRKYLIIEARSGST